MNWLKAPLSLLRPRQRPYTPPRMRIYDSHVERMFEGTTTELAEQLRDGLRYKRALMDIGAALLAGRVCDDVAWFDKHETLFDFIQSALEPDHTEPAPDMLGNFPISRDERRIIEWLRTYPGQLALQWSFSTIAEMIERGEHRKAPEDPPADFLIETGCDYLRDDENPFVPGQRWRVEGGLWVQFFNYCGELLADVQGQDGGFIPADTYKIKGMF